MQHLASTSSNNNNYVFNIPMYKNTATCSEHASVLRANNTCVKASIKRPLIFSQCLCCTLRIKLILKKLTNPKLYEDLRVQSRFTGMALYKRTCSK